ncbi:MAG: thioredoxin family protein [Deltaproteobacteria bacterium]|nr:thioredoxin family protein [Deltaproteobacteria bacterium]
MFGEQELELIRDRLGDCATPLSLTFYPSSSDAAFSSSFERVADAVAKAAGRGVVLRRGRVQEALATPSLTITAPGRGAISYLALPEALETSPFLEALFPDRQIADEKPFARVDEIDQPAQIWVFIAATCPHCPQAVRSANRLARASEKVSTAIVDAQRFSDLAARFNIQSVPATLIDQRLTLTGVIPAEQLLEKILARNSPAFQAGVLLSLIEASRFSAAAAHVLSEGGAADFFALWSQSTISSRMGLLMVVEEVLPKNPEALHGVVDRFIDLLETEDTPLRGDTADLLGRIGDIRAKPALQALLSDRHPDVAEIAAEALEMLR